MYWFSWGNFNWIQHIYTRILFSVWTLSLLVLCILSMFVTDLQLLDATMLYL